MSRTITVNAEVDLDDIETEDLLGEIERRIERAKEGKRDHFSTRFSKEDVSYLLELCSDKLGVKIAHTESLLDQLKYEAFVDAKENFTLDELQKALTK